MVVQSQGNSKKVNTGTQIRLIRQKNLNSPNVSLPPTVMLSKAGVQYLQGQKTVSHSYES